MLTEAELASIRAAARLSLDQTCVRSRPASTKVAGFPVEGAPATTTLPCRVRPGEESAAETVEGGQLRSRSDFEVLFAHDADVIAKDELSGFTDMPGVTMQVLGTDAGASAATLLVAFCIRIQ